MKKLKAIIVSLCLVLTLGGCGKSEETYTAEELANMSEKELAEIIDAEWYSGKVQIDGVVYDLPLTVSELESLV